MAIRSFQVQLSFSLGIGASATKLYQNSGGQKFHIKQIMQQSEGTCDIIDFSNNSNFQYSNASQADPLNINVFPDMDNDTDSLRELAQPIILSGQEQIKFTLLNTDVASNDVAIVLVGWIETEDR